MPKVTKLPPPPTAKPKLPDFEADVLLVSPSANAEMDEINESLKNIHGEIVETMKHGTTTIYKVRIDKGHLEEAEKSLAKDENFSGFQRNWSLTKQSETKPRLVKTSFSEINDPKYPYMIVVSAINQNEHLVNRYENYWGSNYGSPLWFTCPGTEIWVSDLDGQAVAVDGTSFATPICAGIAALIWGAKPFLKNTDVERILIASAIPGQWSPYFGYGLPDAEKAMRLTKGH